MPTSHNTYCRHKESEMCKYLWQKHSSVNQQMSTSQLSAHGYMACIKKQRTVITVAWLTHCVRAPNTDLCRTVWTNRQALLRTGSRGARVKITIGGIHKSLNCGVVFQYILESNPHPFYSFGGLKNQMRIRIACGLDSQSWAGFWKNDRAAVRAVRTTQYNNLLFIILYNIYILLFIRLAVITHNWISLPCRQGAVEGKVRIRTPNYLFFRLRNLQKLVRIRFGCGLDSRIYHIYIYNKDKAIPV